MGNPCSCLSIECTNVRIDLIKILILTTIHSCYFLPLSVLCPSLFYVNNFPFLVNTTRIHLGCTLIMGQRRKNHRQLSIPSSAFIHGKMPMCIVLATGSLRQPPKCLNKHVKTSRLLSMRPVKKKSSGPKVALKVLT